jgi:GDP-4-dehydro-6-deoxy-D-mannose reductase
MHKTLVTGINGFVGHHLARELHEHGVTVICTANDTHVDPQLRPYVSEFYGDCDLTDPQAVAKLPLSEVDSVINLAGLAQVGASFGTDQAERYKHINTAVHSVIALRLIELNKPTATRVIAVSTGAVYDSSQPMPIRETSQLLTGGSPYALSKIAMEQALDGLRNDTLEIVVVRPFNHIGPGQSGGFLVPDLVGKLRNLDTNKLLLIGALNTKRDYTDVRDVARAYRLLATSKSLNHTTYNVCSGQSHSGQEILDKLTESLGIDNLTIKVDPSRIRPNDPSDIYGDASRLRKDTSWEPQISLQQTLTDILAL